MAISTATLPVTVTNTASGGTAPTPGQRSPLSSGLPVQPTPGEVEISSERPAAAEQQTAFNDALLSIINGLLQGQGKELKTQVVAGMAADKDDRSSEETAEATSDTPATPQQMLDALLMASQLPVRPVTLNATPSQSGEAVMMGHRSAGGMASLPVDGRTAGVQPGAGAPDAPRILASPLLTQGMQSVTPQPLATPLGDAAGAFTAAMHPQREAVTGSEKQAPLATQLSTLTLEGGEKRWAQQLQSALGERLQLQVKNQIQHATIRLDPPDMGKIDISMQIENGRLQVHINASQGEVYRALQQVSNDLRQSLTEQNVLQVNVQVSSQPGQQHEGRERQFAQAQATVLAGAEPENTAQDSERHDDKSVLLTV